MPSKSDRDSSLDGRRGCSSCWIMHGWKVPGVRVDWVMVLFVYCVLNSLGVNSIGHKPYCDNRATQSDRNCLTSALTRVCTSRDRRGVFATHTELISQQPSSSQPFLLQAVPCKSHKPHTSSAHALILSSITHRKPFQWCILDIWINI